MFGKFDFYNFSQQREKVINLKSLELEHKLQIEAISKEGLEQVKLGEKLTKPEICENFELEKYNDEKDKIFKSLAQLKNDLEEVQAKDKENKETYLQENKAYNKIIVDSFYSNYAVLQQLVNNTQSSNDINDKDIFIMERFLHNWLSTFGQLELNETTTLGDTELTFIDEKTNTNSSLIEEFTQIIEGQTDKESVLLLDNIKYLLRDKYQENVYLLDKLQLIDMFTITGILFLCIILYVPGTLFLLGLLLYFSYPFNKSRSSNYCLLDENQLVTINSMPSKTLDIVKVYSFELSVFWGVMCSYLVYSLFYV
jgi:hypothetical protein